MSPPNMASAATPRGVSRTSLRRHPCAGRRPGCPRRGLRSAGAPEASHLADERLDAIRVFTLRVLDTAGDVGDEALRAFLASGYTSQNALEVVLGIGTYTMSALANRRPLSAFA